MLYTKVAGNKMRKIEKIILLSAIFILVSCQKDIAQNSSNDDKVVNTLNDDKVLFSLNKGVDYQLVNEKLTEFDIWNERKNDEVPAKIFFYAYTYEEFVTNIDKNMDSDLFEYFGYSSEGFDQIIETYNESYFEENILLFYLKFESNISENYIYSVTKKDETLTLNVNRFQGMSTALSSWLRIVTIKKEDIKEITKIDLIVRTISTLVGSVTIYIDSDYAREFYINPKALKVFDNLKNVEDVILFNWSLNVDLKFNVTVTDEDVAAVVSYLEKSTNVKSVGYKGKDFIRVQMKDVLYDKVVNKTLVVGDIVKDKELLKKYGFSVSILDFIPFSMITFVLKNKGKEYANALVEELKKKNYPFINDDSFE